MESFIDFLIKSVAALFRVDSDNEIGEAPSTTEPIVPGVIWYRTRNGLANYTFRIVRTFDGSYRVYILGHRPYGSRNQGQHETHRLRDGSGDYVCWTSRLETVTQARSVAALWADKTEDYILHGRPF